MTVNRIRELREDRQLTLEQLAERMGISAGYLQRIETGERNLSIKIAHKAANALDVPAVDVMALDAAPMPTGFADDVRYWEPEPGDPMRALKGDNRYLLINDSDALDRLGITAGMRLLVDDSAAAMAAAKPLQPVIVNYRPADEPEISKMLLRQFVPPSLLITNSLRGNAISIDLTGGEAVIAAVVILHLGLS